MKFSFQSTQLPEVLLIEPHVFGDQRGFVMETYQAREFALMGITELFVQDNHSGSEQGTLRGLHYQIRQTQGKLVRVVVGEVYDVAVDLRRNSPTFGKSVANYLSAQNKKQMWIPQGFAHGFYVLSDWAEVVYKVTDFYAPESERTLLWSDPALDISWPLIKGEPPILSAKDSQGLPLTLAEVFEAS